MKKFAAKLMTLALVGLLLSNVSVGQVCKEIIGYYPNWQQYKRNGLFNQKNLDFTKYTIINYAFMSPDENGTIVLNDPWGDNLILGGEIDWANTSDPDNPSFVPYTSMVDLAHQGGAKVMVSLGGWTLSTHFPAVAADPVKRTHFAAECVRMCKKYNFDGIDIDWEFPGASPGNGCIANPNDTENFNLMIDEIRDSLNAYGREKNQYYLLTAAFHSVPYLAAHLDWEHVAKVLDYINLFGYDFYGAWDPITNHNSPLYPPKQGTPGVNQSEGFKLLRDTYKVPAEKLILGIGFYGRSMSGCKGGAGLHVEHSGQPDKDSFPEDEGSPSYYNILGAMGDFERKWDDTAKVPYMLGEKTPSFLGYDDIISVGYKANYIVDNNAAGCLIWEISQDLIEKPIGSGNIVATPLIDKINEVFSSRCTEQASK